MRKLKKELTKDELLSLVLNTVDQINNSDDNIYIIKKIEKMAIEAFSADWAILWLKGLKKNNLYSLTTNEGHKTEIPTNMGLIGRTFNMGQSVVIKQVMYENAYNDSVDNILNIPQKDIIFYPIFSHNKDVIIALLQISNHKKDLTQFRVKDLEKLDILEKYIAPIIRMLRNALLAEEGYYNNTPSKSYDLETNKIIEKLTKEKNNAERMLESSTRFLAEVAHEIRTPMNAIIGFLELLQLDEANDEKRLYIDTALKSGTMMVALVNDLLDFAKIEQGMMELESLVFNPIEEYTAIGPLFSSRMTKNNITFNTFIDPNMPQKIESDPHRIKQVLSNLIGNAVKFTPKNGRILLDISFNKKTEELLFSVIDNGKGIAKNKQEQIFDAFKQEDSSTSREFGGTGLGLSISQKLTNLYNSELKLESEEGKGSKFFFAISLKDKIIEEAIRYNKKLINKLNIKLIFKDNSSSNILEKYFKAFGINNNQIGELNNWNNIDNNTTHIFCGRDSIDQKSIQDLLNKKITVVIMKDDIFKNYKNGLKGDIHELPYAFGPAKLYKILIKQDFISNDDINQPQKDLALVVDDNPINIQFLKAVLDKLDVAIEGANNGQEAVEKYKKSMTSDRPYKIIFMDENMPIMNGNEATKSILNIEKEKKYLHVPIIGLSGDSTDEHRQKSIKAGMDDSITKPVHIKDISNILNIFLDRK